MRFYIKSSLFFFLFSFNFLIAQNNTEKEENTDLIHIIYADYATTNAQYPGKQLLSGNVQIEHNKAMLFCDKAIVDKLENSAIAVGNVRLVQGDTIEMTAGYINYDGNTSFAKATRKVFLKDTKMNLNTDTLYFDRKKQEVYYTSGGTIHDSINTLTSKIGRYFMEEKKFRFINNVHIINPDYQVQSYQLDYFTDSAISNFYGPTKIYNNKSYIYAEKGHYDSRNKISWFVKNAFIKDRHTIIRGDSLYYNQKISYATANKNVVMHDSINNTWVFSDYGQYWGKKDSVEVTQKPLLVTVSEKDTVFFRATKFLVAGKKNNRKLWGYDNSRFYSKDFSGRCDSLYRNDSLRIMKLMKKPVVWNAKSQITGNKIIIKNDSLNKVDSLIIPKNVFIIQKDTLAYNQIKGNKLFGKIINQKIDNVNIYGNAEVIYYLREDDGKLIGIEKNKSSRIYIKFDNGEIDRIRFFLQVDGTIYPEKELNPKTFKGFNWRGDERILSKQDILEGFIPVYRGKTIQKPTETEEEEKIDFIPKKKNLNKKLKVQ